jgi:hypothetical protein
VGDVQRGEHGRRGPYLVRVQHQDKVGPVSTVAFVTCAWLTVCTVAEILAERGVRLYINPSHNVAGDTTARERLDEALAEYKRRIAGV